MAYTRINWENQPSENTPISAENLNIMDLAIDTIDTRSTNLETRLTTAETDIDNLESGWISAIETLTYSSADSPSFVVTTSADMTSKIGLGDRIKLTQTTVKYFIVTAITSNSITLYGGTDYTLTSAAISNFMYSHQKAPFGFPLNPDKWTMLVYSDLEQGTTNPVVETYYNKLSLNLKVGLWNTFINGNLGAVGKSTTTQIRANVTLSTSATTKGSNDITCYVGLDAPALTAGIITLSQFSRSKTINVITPTTYYLNISSVVANASFIGLIGTQSRSEIKAVCAYL